MPQIIEKDLQVNGSLTVAYPDLPDYKIDLCGSKPTSQPPLTYLKVNDQSMGMDNLPGISTVILNQNGTLKAKNSHNIYQSASQWNSWAEWVNQTAKDNDVVAVASYGLDIIPPPPKEGSAAKFLQFIQAPWVGEAVTLPFFPPFALVFIKGQTKSTGIWGGPLTQEPTTWTPMSPTMAAVVGINYRQLCEPFFHVRAPDAVGLFESSGSQAYLRLSTKEGLNNRVEITNRPGGRFSVWTSEGGDALNVKKNGNVGVGTIEPTHRFHVRAPDAVGLFESSGSQAYLRLSTKEGLNNRVEITNRPGGRFSVWTSGGGDALNVTRDGKVGIKTTTPGFALDVADRIRLREGPAGTAGFWLFQTKPNKDPAFIGMADDEGVGFWGSGIGWGLTMNTTNGDIIVTGDIVLQNPGHADCAEEFTIANLETIEPGTVMVLGEEDSLCQSTKAYDKRVAGVVSGAGNFKPALILDKQPDSTNRMPIALMGKVYCKVDAQYAPIEVGDLLTTSPTPGHAMKATDSTKAFGAIIGKALKPLDAGAGLIPILVALQ